jgi:hypothetical protein
VEACQVLTKDRFSPLDPLPQFLSGRTDEHEFYGRADEHEPRESILALNAGVLVMTTALISIAFTLSWGSPLNVFTDIKAAVIDISPMRPDTAQSTRSIRTTANIQALPPAVTGAPTRDESPPAVNGADQKPAEAGALLGQFQAWAATQDGPDQEDGPAQAGSAQDGSIYVAHARPLEGAPAQAQPVRPMEVAPAQDAQDAQAPVRSVQRHRPIRRVQNARAEMRSVRHAPARVRRDRPAQVQVRPAQEVRAPDQPVQPVQPAQNVPPPSYAQRFGWPQQ